MQYPTMRRSPICPRLKTIRDVRLEMALYTGLDLFGDDIQAERTIDAAECAKTCLSMNGVCKAFTFNTSSKITKGPNCFLKSKEGRADGNSVAISGRFLSSVEPDPQNFHNQHDRPHGIAVQGRRSTRRRSYVSTGTDRWQCSTMSACMHRSGALRCFHLYQTEKGMLAQRRCGIAEISSWLGYWHKGRKVILCCKNYQPATECFHSLAANAP